MSIIAFELEVIETANFVGLSAEKPGAIATVRRVMDSNKSDRKMLLHMIKQLITKKQAWLQISPD